MMQDPTTRRPLHGTTWTSPESQPVFAHECVNSSVVFAARVMSLALSKSATEVLLHERYPPSVRQLPSWTCFYPSLDGSPNHHLHTTTDNDSLVWLCWCSVLYCLSVFPTSKTKLRNWNEMGLCVHSPCIFRFLSFPSSVFHFWLKSKVNSQSGHALLFRKLTILPTPQSTLDVLERITQKSLLPIWLNLTPVYSAGQYDRFCFPTNTWKMTFMSFLDPLWKWIYSLSDFLYHLTYFSFHSQEKRFRDDMIFKTAQTKRNLMQVW